MLPILRRVLTYRLMLYYLAVLLAACLVLGAVDLIRFNPIDLAFSTLVIGVTCWIVNWIFARSFGAVTHTDSVLITALILSLIISPFSPQDSASIGFAIFAAAWAVASKYVLATRKRHIFNPAALGAAVAGVALHRTVSWWVGDYVLLLPVVIVGGVVILDRLRYFSLLAGFAVTVLGITLINGGLARMESSASLILLHSMFFFFAFVMLTEPRTAPLGRWRQALFGVLVGVLFSPSVHIGTYYFTPEMALLAGNVFTFLTNKRRLERWGAMLRPAAAAG